MSSSAVAQLRFEIPSFARSGDSSRLHALLSRSGDLVQVGAEKLGLYRQAQKVSNREEKCMGRVRSEMNATYTADVVISVKLLIDLVQVAAAKG